MHVRIRSFGKPDSIVVVKSKLTKIEQLRRIIREKFDVDPKLQRLFYGGKLLEDGYSFHDYNIKLNDVIQLMVKAQPSHNTEKEQLQKDVETEHNNTKQDKDAAYEDATSSLYELEDLVDVRDREQGAWLEAKIVRIVRNREAVHSNENGTMAAKKEDMETSSDRESDIENKPPSVEAAEGSSAQRNNLLKFITTHPRARRQSSKESTKGMESSALNTETDLLYKVQLEDMEDSDVYCKESEIRPRARTVLAASHLQVGEKVMLNYNTEEPLEKGFWYDFKIEQIKKSRWGHELVGTLYLGAEAVPQHNTRVRLHDKVFAVERPRPIARSSERRRALMKTQPDKRSQPLKCRACRDVVEDPCAQCGCCVCRGKEAPDKIVLCDECDRGYHMDCLQPPLPVLPAGDWYCPQCARDPGTVVAPGAARQPRKQLHSARDWGRGMACVGKSKTCSMPANHFGPIPGIEVGMCWRFRIQLSESGVHRPPVSGIHGRDVEGAYSIVLSGGYEDDVDRGEEFTYTGSGGRDLSGNKRTAEQSCDQTLTRENKALARNCAAAAAASEAGGDAGARWRCGRPVRVVRSYKMQRHFPKYAPPEGIRYDGIYKVVKYYPERGLSGFRVWKYLLRRDDPAPAPWEPGAKQYPIIYPDGYLEAEAEKKALKEKKSKSGGGGRKKRALNEHNCSSESKEEAAPPAKKAKASGSNTISNSTENMARPATYITDSPRTESEGVLTHDERLVIAADAANGKLWRECLEAGEARGKTGFVETVTQAFLCIICQEVVVRPVTTPCSHNFCLACLQLAFKSSDKPSCPCCRRGLEALDGSVNEQLRTALRTVMPGYDAGRK